ncbi:MAG: hypothetical protein HPY90_05560 [Syntrophothermus sp.]|uniref:SAF domain-containing protein n=1 Tax=Syntrophothermus sp. TaxID=2736299 RepID=UPI00257963EC|nr:SAF domain-containing protein [Syntrophothermus sp.]NSW82731.1 hypothetical protein [Syntrophothermus sp.]
MSRKVGIIVSVVLAVVFTLGIMFAANQKYADVKRTVDAVKVVQFIPQGSEIKPEQVTTVKVPEALAKDLVKNPNDIVGKTAKVSMVEGQYVYLNSAEGKAKNPNMVEVCVPVDLSSSANVTAGDTVDIYMVDKGAEGRQAVEIYRGARVLHSYDQQGKEISPVQKVEAADAVSPQSMRVPAAVSVEVPKEAAAAIVQAGSKKAVYLVKAN